MSHLFNSWVWYWVCGLLNPVMHCCCQPGQSSSSRTAVWPHPQCPSEASCPMTALLPPIPLPAAPYAFVAFTMDEVSVRVCVLLSLCWVLFLCAFHVVCPAETARECACARCVVLFCVVFAVQPWMPESRPGIHSFSMESNYF